MGGGSGGGGGGEIMLLIFYFCDIAINCLVWGWILFADAIRLEILFIHNLCDDVCEARVWI